MGEEEKKFNSGTQEKKRKNDEIIGFLVTVLKEKNEDNLQKLYEDEI